MFDTFIQKISDKEPFSFSRWGDGEWNSVLGIDGENYKNTDGHTYFSDMGWALANVLKSKPGYYLGMQRFAREERYPDQINAFLKDNDLENLNWVNADMFHHASIKGYFDQFFDVLVKRDDPVILVGPDYLKDLGKFYNMHVSVPEKNCWLETDRILKEVRASLSKAYKSTSNYKDAIVLFVSGMPANYMIDVLYKEFGDQHTFLDMGSVFDVYVGRCTRGYHKKVLQRIQSEGK